MDSAVGIALRLTEALTRAGFRLTQLASSHPRALVTPNIVPERPIDLNFEDNTIERTLGLLWEFRQDGFQLSVNTTAEVTTKRQLF